MPIEQIKPGMKGYGLTVFEGTRPERFEVEVLGLLDGLPNPKQKVIIARLGGPLIARTGVFAGMSGSPVYIEGKLVGAVAFTFQFSKEPIAGITPISYMIENSMDQSNPPRPKKLISPLRAAQAAQQGLVPIATPLAFSGIPEQVVEMFAEELKGLGIYPIAGISGGSDLSPMGPAEADTLAPGSSVSVQLVRGDFTIDAAGTVTYRDGDRIYAFGHPFLGLGSAQWPMAESSVVTVVPNLNNSFKLSVGGRLVGSITQDRSTGVFGRLGQQPRMIKMQVAVHTSRNKTETYNFEIVSDSLLTPILARITTLAAISATERSLGSHTLKLNGRILIGGHDNVILDNSFSAPNGAALAAAASVEKPLSMLMNSGFEDLDLQGIQLEVTSIESRSMGTLSRIWVDKTEVRRGERIELQIFARNDGGTEVVERVPLELPTDAPLGPLTIAVGDGASISQLEIRSADFVPKDLDQLIRAINKMKRNNRLYVKVMRAGAGAIVNNEEMPTLPPSVLAALNSQRTAGGYAPLSVATIAEQELSPWRSLISGLQTITITVVR
jgi:hypothetical protein